MYTLFTLPWAPAIFQGQVRDLPVRWALEEIGASYQVELVDDAQRQSPAFLAKQPFGKVPVLQEGDLHLFESGAIVQHLAENSWLMPAEPQARAQVRAWMFAAANTLDPDIIALGDIDHFAADQSWAQVRRPEVERCLFGRLNQLARALETREFLAGTFSAADILMVATLRGLRHTDLVSRIAPLRDYRDRCEARQPFQRALSAQLETFARHARVA